ncbi:AIR synthase related protein [Clostridium peptidivorans]|uniref:AIR synthase related protein n=1 Tax=Clostridium peptidivorans TaxID=100174 RepID=UPI000BE29B10|nr:AIR synthase related protein [Clostridium peptidivorans]
MKISKVRDLTLISLDESKTMVVACDSCGSIGMKEGDALKVPHYYVGKLTVRVPLMEVMCAGAEVVTITDAVCNEMEPTGSEIIRGIKEELKLAGIGDIALTGSTEENFKSISTGLGVTVIGIAENKNLKVNAISENCKIISLGIPKVGAEIGLDKDLDIVNYDDLKKLLSLDGVYEIVPVGSKGIHYEALQLAKNNNMKFVLNEEIKIDIHKTAGPSTVVIAAVKNEILNKIQNDEKVSVIGELNKV